MPGRTGSRTPQAPPLGGARGCRFCLAEINSALSRAISAKQNWGHRASLRRSGPAWHNGTSSKSIFCFCPSASGLRLCTVPAWMFWHVASRQRLKPARPRPSWGSGPWPESAAPALCGGDAHPPLPVRPNHRPPRSTPHQGRAACRTAAKKTACPRLAEMEPEPPPELWHRRFRDPQRVALPGVGGWA